MDQLSDKTRFYVHDINSFSKLTMIIYIWTLILTQVFDTTQIKIY